VNISEKKRAERFIIDHATAEHARLKIENQPHPNMDKALKRQCLPANIQRKIDLIDKTKTELSAQGVYLNFYGQTAIEVNFDRNHKAPVQFTQALHAWEALVSAPCEESTLLIARVWRDELTMSEVLTAVGGVTPTQC
jgi:hypothetical protein